MRTCQIMLLANYLTLARITRAAFARKLGTSKGYLSDIINGKRRASLDMALKIQTETEGAVTPAEIDAPWRDNNPPSGGGDSETGGGGKLALAVGGEP